MARDAQGRFIGGKNVGTHMPIEEMNAWLAEIRKAEKPIGQLALSLGGEALVSEAQVASPVKSGFLKGSHIKTPREPGGADQVKIGATAKYAMAVHERIKDPEKRRWFYRVIVNNGQRILNGALQLAFKRVTGGNG